MQSKSTWGTNSHYGLRNNSSRVGGNQSALTLPKRDPLLEPEPRTSIGVYNEVLSVVKTVPGP
jgi:hypothetical protein